MEAEERCAMWRRRGLVGVERITLKEKLLGDDLLSRTVSSQVPSVLAGLTAGFGMGPGVPPPL